ncbi:holin [Lacticaseibacillus suilingensis]|uniref:holin n=1 Tax=Lacticaseibacillus suilingensis TaxID=2799577 RepID=UPI0022E7611A|nr:holin [Lacticaseibacillus suilingensis]
MENELLQLTVIAVVLAPITAALVQAIKSATGLDAKKNTLVSLLIGIVLAGLWALTFGHVDQIGPYLMAGLLSGLSASGLYDLTKKGEEQ